jgi:peptidyl-prolyl cis-trans isomerase C
MRRLSLAAALSAALLSSTVMAASAAAPAISQARIDAVIHTLEAQGQQITPKMRDSIRDQLATAEILRQEAVRKGLDKSPEYQAELQNMQSMTLANRLISDFQRSHPVSDSELKATYAKLKAQTPERKSYHSRHILVKTEAEAKALLEALKKGKPFAQLAKEKSVDPGSKDNGGDLGWTDASAFVGPFAEALTKLSKGQVTSKPVQTQFGWHIIQLEDVRSEGLPPLETIRPQLQQRAAAAQIDQYINSLKAKAAQ